MPTNLLGNKKLLIGLALLLVLAAFASQFRIRFPSRPTGEIGELAALRQRNDLNVVFILIDTLRSDRLGSYGFPRDTSPEMDDLAASGVRFAHVESQSSWTKCSMASLWTGLFPTHTGILRFNDAIPKAATLPAEIFRRAGYVTAGIYRNGWVGPNFGFGQGFDSYLKPSMDAKVTLKHPVPGVAQLGGTDADATLAGQEFLRNYGDKKFFLYLHYMDVHQYAYDSSVEDPAFGSSISDIYDLAIRWTDKNVGAIVNQLEKQKLFKKTILVIAADHGEAFLEHGVEGHARNLYREVVDVPLILALPFRLSHELTVQTPVRNVDIWPTILDLVGLPPLPRTDGTSLVPAIQAAARGEVLPERASFGYLDQRWGRTTLPPKPLVALHEGSHRILYNTTSPEKSLEVFDRASDPDEHHNLREHRPEWVSGMLTQLEALAEERPVWKGHQIELDDFYKSQLRALGYIVK